MIAGEGEELAILEQAVVTRGLASRVKLIGRIDERQLLEHLAQCRAVCFPPFDEDYGFVTIEAFSSGKPVITCRDSGGAAELVAHEATGLVAEPSPSSLAPMLRRLMDDAALAERMGKAAAEVAAGITWSDTVRKLVPD